MKTGKSTVFSCRADGMPPPTSFHNCLQKIDEQLIDYRVIARPKAVAISWYAAQMLTNAQEIATSPIGSSQ